MRSDSELLEQYAQTRDEAAFAELVRRHLNHVYSTALRLVGGDTHLAEDVAQMVFADLARKAEKLVECRALSGWLHTSARFAAAKVVRSEQRRRQREQTVAPMPDTSSDAALTWAQARAVLDETIGELDETDREALLLRYFEEKPFAEVGSRTGLSENAARMRVERALEKLRGRLVLKGVTSTVAMLGTALAQFAVGTVPAALETRIVQSVHAGASATATGGSLLVANRSVLILAGLGVAIFLGISLKRGAKPTGATDPTPNVLQMARASDTSNPDSKAVPSEQPKISAAPHGPELLFVDELTGRPITNQTIKLKGWERNAHLLVRKEVPLQEGHCVAPFDPGAGPDYRLYTDIEGYAVAHLHWKLAAGESLPESYTVRLVRPALIGGRVLDPAGQPVAGATVGFNTENVAAEDGRPDDHCVDYLTVETDAGGRWQMRSLAPEMVARIFGCASHPDFAQSAGIQTSRQPEVIPELTKCTHVFHLGEAFVVGGSVLDTNLQPIAGARVHVGRLSHSGDREAETDSGGNFSVRGCPPGPGLVSAEAKGFAPAVTAIQIGTGLEPVRFTLGAGKPLHLRIVDTKGEAVSGANIMLDSFPRSQRLTPMPQIELRRTADRGGHIVWSNAPEQELEFDVHAPGYVGRGIVVRPSDQEHQVTLQGALVISGTVRDAVTGEAIPRFRIGIGWPRPDPAGPFGPAEWSTIDRFWPTFRGGEFRHTLTEPVSGISANRYVFRFEADGHAPFVSRTYTADEGDVSIAVTLQPVEDIHAVAYTADGRTAVNVQVGMMFPGTDARLVQGGFAGELGHAIAWVRRTDAAGRFIVPGGEKIESVVVASPDGYAEATLAELKKTRAVRLRPWGRVEGIVQSSGVPIANGTITLIGSGFLTMEPEAFKAAIGADGRFSVQQAPPGSLVVFLSRSGSSRRIGTVEVRAGQTAEATLEAEITAEPRVSSQ